MYSLYLTIRDSKNWKSNLTWHSSNSIILPQFESQHIEIMAIFLKFKKHFHSAGTSDLFQYTLKHTVDHRSTLLTKFYTSTFHLSIFLNQT